MGWLHSSSGQLWILYVLCFFVIPNRLYSALKWLHLPTHLVPVISLSIPYPSLHPACVLPFLSQLPPGLPPGGLFTLEDGDGLYHCLKYCWGRGGLDICCVLLVQRLCFCVKSKARLLDTQLALLQTTCYESTTITNGGKNQLYQLLLSIRGG